MATATVDSTIDGDGRARDRIDAGVLLAALRSFRDGNFDARLPNDLTGVAGDIAQAYNDCLYHNRKIADELDRMSRLVERDGQISKRASLEGAKGAWRGCIESVNQLIDDLAFPMTETGRVLGAVAKGDLSQRMPLEAGGHPLTRSSRAASCPGTMRPRSIASTD